MHISYSRMSLYMSCPRAHWYRYVQGLSQKRPVRPLYFGTDFHKLLELRNKPEELTKAMSDIKDAFYELPSSWQEDLGEDYPTVLMTIFEDYQRVYKDVRQPQVTELEFELEVASIKGEPIIFVGKIDELYLLKHSGKKRIIIGEHKTFSKKPNSELLVMNTQKCLYAKAAQFLKGVLPDTVKWDYIRSSPAEEPVWLEKSKRFSGAKSSKITPFSWERACASRGITDPKILQQKSVYEGNIPEFFFQVLLPIDPTMVEDVWESYLFTAKQIVVYGQKNKARNITPNCSFCSFKDICYTEMTGGDVEYLISRDFIQKGKDG